MEKYRNFRLCGYVYAYYLAEADEEKIRRDIDFARYYTGMDKVYLESHRALVDIPGEKLRRVKALFEERGFEVSGGITATALVGEAKPSLFDCFCFSTPEHRARFMEIVRRTAEVFDEIILDDYFFSSCRCERCIEAKGQLSWEEFKARQFEEVSREIVALAKEVNPRCRFVIKYPNWYESYQATGYDPGRQKDIFDGVYTGTESRASNYNGQHLQRYLSYSLPRFLENTAPGRNGGGWIDLGGASGEKNMWLEQANYTLFSGMKELMLFNFASVTQGDSLPPLGTDLKRVDALLGHLGKPTGVSAYEPHGSDGEDQLMNYLGMCGIPLEPKPEFDFAAKTVFLAENAAFDPDVVEKLRRYVRAGGRAVITGGFLKAAWDRGIREMTSLRPTGRRVTGTRYQINYLNIPDGNIHQSDLPVTVEIFTNKNNATWNDVLLHVNDFCTPLLTADDYGKGTLHTLIVPDNFGDLYRIPGPIWGFIGKIFGRGAPVFLGAEPKASLFLYDNGTFGVYNCRTYGTPLELTLTDTRFGGFEDLETGERFTAPHHENPLPRRMGDAASFRPEPLERVFRLHIAPGEFRFYRLLPGRDA